MATNEDLAAYRNSFDMFDKDGDGFISQEEFAVVLKNIGIEADEEEVQNMIWTVSHNEQIDFDAFVKIMRNESPSGDTEENVIRCMKALDYDNSGKINAYELKHIMLHLSKELKEGVINEMLKEVDKDANGMFDYERFGHKMFEK